MLEESGPRSKRNAGRCLSVQAVLAASFLKRGRAFCTVSVAVQKAMRHQPGQWKSSVGGKRRSKRLARSQKAAASARRFDHQEVVPLAPRRCSPAR